MPVVRCGGGRMSPGLPVGTRVRIRGGAQRTGTVMLYEQEHSRGTFPVKLDDGIWQIFNASDVIVLAPPKKADQ